MGQEQYYHKTEKSAMPYDREVGCSKEGGF